MKPTKLIMSAFGSFADVQEIDFTELGATGLYLITGETGSGKTTIFDAISFALFGKASGTSRDDYSMLRSDFAPEKSKTFVELDFVSGGDQYRIRRAIKKSGQDVVLILPDGAVISGERNTKSKIMDIIGLDREQFAQIIMIAQNDFLRFMHSGTDERVKILRNIFGTEALKQFQERLKSLVKSESDKRALLIHDFERYDVDVYKRDEKFEQWEAQISADMADLAEINLQLSAFDKKKQTLAASLATAEELGKKLSSLAGLQRDLAEHAAKFGEMADSRLRARRGEISLRNVKPYADELEKSMERHSAAAAEAASAKADKAAAVLELDDALSVIGALPPLTETQNAYAAVLKEWEALDLKQNKLTELQINRNEIADKQIVLAGIQEELNAALDMLSKLPSIADFQTRLDKTASDLKNEEDMLAIFSSLNISLSFIENKDIELAKEQSEYMSICKDFDDADKYHRVVEEAFLHNQAGIIACNLIDGEPCPVCGSLHHPSPAAISGDVVSEQDLKRAREAKEYAQAKRESKSSLCGALKTEIETLTKRFSADISTLASDVTIETASMLLPDIINKKRSNITELSKTKSDSEQTIAEIREVFENSTKKQDDLTPIAASLKSEVDTLIKRFILDLVVYIPNAQWASSESELAELLAQTHSDAGILAARKDADKDALELLVQNLKIASKRKADAESAALSAQTLVAEREATEQKQLKLREGAHAAFEAALRNNGFSDEAIYKAALVSENELDGLRKQILDYDTQGEQLKRDIIRLEGETAGKGRPDIERLRLDAEAADIESKALYDKRDDIGKRLSKTESALNELRSAAVMFEKVEKAYASIKQLADTANGRLDFETYAQMAYFESVLRAANQRLKAMSQNRYTLLRKTDSDDGRKRSGLELEVLDAYTGKARSANSLSGGESFMASLSLALGLSDVVQQSAGGIRLDAMFIDEGFGTLDADVLDIAINTLSEMAGMNRIIGIISHVAELRERIDKQVQVEKTPSGSRIYLSV